MKHFSSKILEEIQDFYDIETIDLNEKEIQIWSTKQGSERDINRLIHKLWLLGLDNFYGDEYTRNKQRATHYSLLSQKLFSAGCILSGISVSKSCLRIATKYGLTSTAIEMNRNLLRHHMLRGHNLREGKRYQKNIQYLKGQLVLEMEAEVAYTSIIYSFNKRRQSDDLPKLKREADHLESRLNDCHTPLFQYFARYLIHMRNYYLGFDVERHLLDSVKYFEGLEFNFSTGTTSMINLLVDYYTDHKKYVPALELLDERLQGLIISDNAHGKLLLSKMRIELNLGLYAKAEATYSLINKPRYANFLKKELALQRLYLNLLTGSGRVNIKSAQLDDYRKDKTGMNLSLMIIDLFNNVKKGNYDYLKEVSEKYLTYLRQHKVFHSKESVIIQLLLLVPLTEYAMEKFDKRSAKLLRKLPQSTPKALEILDYDRIWKDVIQALMVNS